MQDFGNFQKYYLIRKNVTNIEGINGKLKILYEDFHVHEITKDNEIVHLHELIDKNKIDEAIKENEEKETNQIITSLQNLDTHWPDVSKNLNEFNQKVIKEFLKILHEIYQLKIKQNEQSTEEIESKNENGVDEKHIEQKNKDCISIPYCYLINVCDETEQKEEEDSSEEWTHNKNKRKEIHNFVKKYYPFLTSETKKVNNSEPIISHGNILNSHSYVNTISSVQPTLVNMDSNELMDVIEIRPSATCLKSILPKWTFRKLKKKFKKFRFPASTTLEYISLERPTEKEEPSIEHKEPYKELELKSNLTNGDSSVRPPMDPLEKEISYHSEKKRKLMNGNIMLDNEEDEQKDSNKIFCLENMDELKRRKKEEKKKKRYIHFNLYKENRDICQILNKFKTILNKRASDISYCGIKDKRGITVQKFCLSKTKKEDIYKCIQKNEQWFKNVYVSNLEYKTKRLSLGNLKGNFFRILIRGVDKNAYEQSKLLINNLEQYGFINYYGEQRFGSKKIKNYEIGKYILKKEYTKAMYYILENVELIEQRKNQLHQYLTLLHESNEEKRKNEKKKEKEKEKEKNVEIDTNKEGAEEESNIIDNERTKNPTTKNTGTFKKQKKENKRNQRNDTQMPQEIERIINSISSKLHIEKNILKALKKTSCFKNAFMSLPKDIFSLFIHSLQSIIFNILANIRMRKFGFQVVVGDLVEVSTNENSCGTCSSTEEDDASKSEHKNKEENGEELPFTSEPIEYIQNTINEQKNVIMVTEKNIHCFEIYDVVLPLPGDHQHIVYPKNLMEEYINTLNHFDLTFEDFKSEKHFFGVSGGFRKLVVKPTDMQALFINANTLNVIPMIKSDLFNLTHKRERVKNTLESETTKDYTTIGFHETQLITQNKDSKNVIEDNIHFVPTETYDTYLIKEIPNYKETASIYLSCSLPKSSYITSAFKEILLS